MRVRVASQRIAAAAKREKAKNKWRKNNSVHQNTTGRIQLKDLQGSSYMKLGYYNRVHLPSYQLRIIDLVEETKEKSNKTSKFKVNETFEFKKRADRFNRELSNINDTNLPLLDLTRMDSNPNDKSAADDMDFKKIRQNTDESEFNNMSDIPSEPR